mmetsp:Transcript_43910/g.110184  ORF Transcript_43910/g.110184 Transcript_43910/m.110184 type:complete len:101 (-) Transcript_43910:860-1162(-)
MARIIHAKRNVYDAFLVVHGTDTLSYTASALSMMLLVCPRRSWFMCTCCFLFLCIQIAPKIEPSNPDWLQGFKKPIIITGSQLPLLMPRSDARQNLIGTP